MSTTMPVLHRSSPALPVTTQRVSLAAALALIYLALVLYASLYPFGGWRWQGVLPWAFLFAPWPQHWTWFDLSANLLAYVPLGLLLTLALARSGYPRAAIGVGLLLPCLLSLVLEATQSLLVQHRVPSQVDWLLNSLGGALGVALALLLLRSRWPGRWTALCQSALVAQTYAAVLLLALWPVALLYPTSVPFGLGQVWPRLEQALLDLVAGTFMHPWLPQALPGQPLSPLTEALVVALCLWAPLLLGYALLRRVGQRLVFLWLALPLALGVLLLSASLTYGPLNAWAWLTPAASLGLIFALALGLLSLALGQRSAAVLSLLAWVLALALLNRAPEAAYFAQSLQIWEQGRFIRLYGLTQWLGWLWPYAALAVGLRLALRPMQRSAPYNNRV